MNIIIQNINDKDIEKIVELTNNAYAVAHKQGFLITRANDTNEKIIKELQNGAKIFTAKNKRKIAGAVRYEIKNDVVRLYKLAVMPEYRKQSIGSLLTQKVFDVAKKLGLNKVKIEVHEGKGLILYYEKFGFKIKKDIDIKTITR